MFLNGLKVKSILRRVNAVISERKYAPLKSKPVHIGLVQNQAHPFSISKLDKLAKSLGVRKNHITMLSFVSALSKEDKKNETLLSASHIGWNGVFKAAYLKEFSQKRFDILISYYEKDELPLVAMNGLSKAGFKVGISPLVERMNDLTILVKEGEEDVFIAELEKYLKILKIIN